MSNFTKTMCFTLACGNDPMISNFCYLSLCMEESSKKYFRFIIDSIGSQMYPIISLFSKYPLNKLSTLICQDFYQIVSLTCRHTCIVSLNIPSLGHPLENFDCWLNCISFKVTFNQAFLKSSGNLVTFAKLLDSGMKCDTSEPGYPKLGNGLFSSFTTALKTLCKTLTILFTDISDPFHSLCVCQIWSRIFNLASPALSSGCIWLPSWMSSRAFVLIYMSEELLSVDYS